MGVAVLDSLRGLALGDGFGERWFHRSNREAIEMIKARQLPSEAPWYWTDDTAMALTVVRMLRLHGEIRRDVLAEMFGATYQADPFRGYGYGMTVLLPRLAEDPRTWDMQARSPRPWPLPAGELLLRPRIPSSN